MFDYEELEVTTASEDGYKSDETELFLANESTSSELLVVRDRTGLRLSFYGLVPYSTGYNGEPAIWRGRIVLDSAELEVPEVEYKLRATVKKTAVLNISCNRNQGSICRQSDDFVLTFQLPENCIKAIQLTLLVDGNPHEVPLYKAINQSPLYSTGNEFSHISGLDDATPDNLKGSPDTGNG